MEKNLPALPAEACQFIFDLLKILYILLFGQDRYALLYAFFAVLFSIFVPKYPCDSNSPAKYEDAHPPDM